MDHIFEFAFGAMDEACISGQQNRRTNAIHMRGVQQGVLIRSRSLAGVFFYFYFFQVSSPFSPGVNILFGFPVLMIVTFVRFGLCHWVAKSSTAPSKSHA